MGADDVATAVESAGARATSRLSFVECGAAFARAVRDGRVSRRDAARFTSDFDDAWQDIAIVELDEAISRRAVALIGEHPLRSADAIHLASALAVLPPVGEVTFACFDRRLWDAAAGLGFDLLPATPP